MNSKRFTDYLGTPRPRKVKHVKFFAEYDLDELELAINQFADEHSDYKILGIKLVTNAIALETNYVGVVTYLENAKGVEYTDYEDDSYED